MEVKQVHALVNQALKETLGAEAVLNEDLSNVVDMGEAVFGANKVDNYVKSLVNHIGRVIFVNRPYSGYAPNVMRDKWEYGSVMEKVRSELPEVTVNDTWNLTDGQDYSPYVLHLPKASAKFWNTKLTFEIDRSIGTKQVKESFSNPAQLGGFTDMIFNEISKSLTIATDNLVMRGINRCTADVLSGVADLKTTGNAQAVNLLALYNAQFGTKLTFSQALATPEFFRYASFVIGNYRTALQGMSNLYNLGKTSKFTPANLQHLVMLGYFANAAKNYLYGDTYHEEYVKLPAAEIVPYWQGSGITGPLDVTSASTIDIKTTAEKTVKATGVLAVLFDHDAVAVCNEDNRVHAITNPRIEVEQYFYKRDMALLADMDENFVVFYAA